MPDPPPRDSPTVPRETGPCATAQGDGRQGSVPRETFLRQLSTSLDGRFGVVTTRRVVMTDFDRFEIELFGYSKIELYQN